MKIDAIDAFYLAMPKVTEEADGSQDAAVILMRALGAAAGEEALFAALPEEVDQSAHDPDDGAIVGSGGDGGMEVAGGRQGHRAERTARERIGGGVRCLLPLC